MGLIEFMATSAGRVLRIVVGVVLIAVGLLVLHGKGGVILAIVGLVPLGAGVFDVCVLAPLFRLSIVGSAIRQHQLQSGNQRPAAPR